VENRLEIGGNGHDPAIEDIDYTQKTVYGGQVENALRNSEAFNTIRAMIEPGDNVQDMLMRGNVPEKVKKSHQTINARVIVLKKALKFKNKAGVNLMLNLFAAETSASGIRIKEVVQAVTGINFDQSQGWRSDNDSINGKIRKLAFGDAKKGV